MEEIAKGSCDMPRSAKRRRVTRCARPRSVTRDSSVQQQESTVYTHKAFQREIPNMRDKGDGGREGRGKRSILQPDRAVATP